jgi:hypothetical protein
LLSLGFYKNGETEAGQWRLIGPRRQVNMMRLRRYIREINSRPIYSE